MIYLQSSIKCIFIAWRKLSRRTELLSKYTECEYVLFKGSITYVDLAYKTMRYIDRYRPEVIVAQLPPGPLLAVLAISKRFYGYRLIVDIHTSFLVYDNIKSWILNRPFRFFLKYCDNILVHNDDITELLPRSLRDKTIVVYDPWPLIVDQADMCKESEDYIVFPASYAPDEPLEEVLSAISRSDFDIKLYVTGNWRRRKDLRDKYKSNRIIFTGYLPMDEYYKLLCKAKAVITGTKREYTLLMSAWEAVAFRKPLIVNKTRTLEKIFKDYAIFYDYKNPESIIHAINMVKDAKIDEATYRKLLDITLNSIDKLLKIIKTP